MLSIAIDRVHARYLMPPLALREQPRVQRIMDDALTRVLEGEIEREGIASSGYVCIREMNAVAIVRLREPDSLLASGVGSAIAGAIRRLIDEGSSAVVEYGSRAHALVDLASSAMAGDFSRSWAWTQVGIWRADFPLRTDVTADLIVRALAKEPTHGAAIAAYLARERADRFGELIARATPNAWDALARAAWLAAGGVGDPAARSTSRAGSTPDAIDRHTHTLEEIDPERRRRHGAESLARRVVTRSAIARVSIARFASAHRDTRRAVALLALLDVEPSAVRSGEIAPLLTAIERAMQPKQGSDTWQNLPAVAEEGSDTSQDLPAAARLEQAASAWDASESPTNDLRRPQQEPRDETMRAPSVEDRRTAQGNDSDAVGTAPDVRRLAYTRHGGLLYLVNLLPRIGLVDHHGQDGAIRRDERWSDRGLRWVLHQLAMMLAGIDPADPAALVFAGLVPDAPPPSSMQDPPTDVERAALETLRATVARALRDTLGGLDEPHAEASDERSAACPEISRGEVSRDEQRRLESDQALVDEVCRRGARIAADPGWIEARFSVEDVSLDIRRAGLDLNPDWVPWLGVVLRFVYD